MARIANTLVNDPDKIKTAAGLLMTMNGSPFVYYGEEIGMNSSGTKDEISVFRWCGQKLTPQE